jgi:hypothetical protein
MRTAAVERAVLFPSHVRALQSFAKVGAASQIKAFTTIRGAALLGEILR